MYEIVVFSHFSGAHRLRYLHGQCEKLHGHNWKIEAHVTSRHLGKDGIALDFGLLKEKLGAILNDLDHTYLNDLSYFKSHEPSSENIARYVFDRLRAMLKGHPATLKKVTAWESDTASASYLGGKR